MPIAEQLVPTTLDIAWVRSQFPSLAQTVNGHPAVFFDGPGGTQVPRQVIDAISAYLARDNANIGGAYQTSRNTDRVVAEARAAMADFLNCDAEEIVFGQNMTSLTYAISRSIERELGPGDEIVLTLLDHDANFSPWKALEEKGVIVRAAKLNPADCTLDMDDLAQLITSHTKLVAVGYASNAVGTINDVKEVVRLARQVGALSYIDAVHYAPHGLIDVRALDCDFLVCSTYKFFGPHMGVLYGKREHLERLKPYKVRPLTNAIPGRWEWGTMNHECIAGIKACVDYWEELGRRTTSATKAADETVPGFAALKRCATQDQRLDGSESSGVIRREAIIAAHAAAHGHEGAMTEKMIAGLAQIPGSKLYGIREPRRFDQRCATFAIRIDGHTPLELATHLGNLGFFTWDGNYYALNLSEQLDVEKSGGFLRIGLVHYNTMEEVDRLLAALREIVA
ncbi:MAG TPA: cysteine desulfurase-like protein [Terriglobales bacterium]|nr:cysteine desulfurase-like protein [Terriglobales bacterium]